MSLSRSLVWTEAPNAGEVVGRQLERHAALIQTLGENLRERQPLIVLTGVRGFSDPAASSAKFTIETWPGVFVASLGAIALSKEDRIFILIAPLRQVTSLYAFAEGLSHARGRNPDAPSRPNKVTKTQ